MDTLVTPAETELLGPFPVPPSKSEHQRCLALAALAGRGVGIRSAATGSVGEDVERLGAALREMGPWEGGALGHSRASLHLDLGEGATGFRYAVALATLRPPGARTLVTGRPVLRARPHGTLLRALRGLGGHVVRRGSGAVRIIGGGLTCGGAGGDTRRIADLTLDTSTSSQFASTLLLLAPRIGGLRLALPNRSASLPYLRTTISMLERFGIRAQAEGLGGPGGRIQVPAGAPAADEVSLAPDASCAAAWWTAVALRGGEAVVPGVCAEGGQADVRLLDLLQRMGVQVDVGPGGAARVRGTGARLHALGTVDLSDAPDLIFLVGVLAAGAEGETVLRGVAAARSKESDRVAVLVAGLEAVGARVAITSDNGVRVRGGPLHGGRVTVAGDHRAAFAFGVLGLTVPGIRLGGASRAVGKSHPGFLEALAHLGG